MLFDEPAAWLPTLAVIVFLYCTHGTFLCWIAIAACALLILAVLS